MLRNYFEIISREEWKDGGLVKRTFKHAFDPEKYKQVAPKLFELFRNMNGGKLQKTIVLDFKTKKIAKLNSYDAYLVAQLLELGYAVDKISYISGKALKEGKEVKILDILNSLESKIKTKDKMKEVFEKTRNPVIEKQLKFIDNFGSFGLITGNKINLRQLSIFQGKEQKRR